MNTTHSTHPTLLFGLGTGRCGTQSLAHLLNLQANAEVYHEMQGHTIAWQGSEAQIDEFLTQAIHKTNKDLVGDVALYYLPYVAYILARQPTAKFICLQRDCAATVQSYLQQTEKTNHWIDHQGIGWQQDDWDHCYPKYKVSDKESALTLYWQEYYAQATALQQRYPNSVRIFPTERLNSEAGQQEILTFVGIPDPAMRTQIGLRRNSSRYKKLHRLGGATMNTAKEVFQSVLRKLVPALGSLLLALLFFFVGSFIGGATPSLWAKSAPLPPGVSGVAHDYRIAP